jgi:hypothetical protein
MPEFEVVPLKDAQSRTAFTGRRGQNIQEYVGYIHRLGNNQAGKLQIAADEKITTVRRRLSVAAEALGVNLVIKHSGEELYFWAQPSAEERPRGGRRRRNQSKEGRPWGEAHGTEVEQQVEQH